MTSGQRPLVSIVLPTVGDAPFLEASIESSLAQTYGEFELIVVDGGQSERSSRRGQSIADRRVRWVHQSDCSDRLPGALNLGFAQARGELFTWTQDDDLLAPQALAVLVDGLRQYPDVGMVYAGTVLIDESGAVIRAAPAEPPEALSRTNPVGHSFLYRRAVAEAVGPYDPAFLMAEDFHYWLRIYRRFPMARLDGDLCFHRLHPDSLTGTAYGAYEALRVCAKARRAVLGLPGTICRRQIAAAYVEEAFRAYQRRDYGHVWPSLVRAALRDPRELALMGVGSIAIRSLIRT